MFYNFYKYADFCDLLFYDVFIFVRLYFYISFCFYNAFLNVSLSLLCCRLRFIFETYKKIQNSQKVRVPCELRKTQGVTGTPETTLSKQEYRRPISYGSSEGSKKYNFFDFGCFIFLTIHYYFIFMLINIFLLILIHSDWNLYFI